MKRQGRSFGNSLKCTHSGFQALSSMAHRLILSYRIMKLVSRALNLKTRDFVLRKIPKVLYASLPRASNKVFKVHLVIPICLKALRKPPKANFTRPGMPERQGRVLLIRVEAPLHIQFWIRQMRKKSLKFSWNGWMLVHNCR